MTHPQQAAELQGFDSVAGHEQPVHSAQPLQHGGDVRERVKEEPETAELHQVPQLIRQTAQVIPIQTESLQATREENTGVKSAFIWNLSHGPHASGNTVKHHCPNEAVELYKIWQPVLTFKKI